MGSNGPKRRSTRNRWMNYRDGKCTAPTPMLENVFFGRGKSFKRMLDVLSAHLGELELSKLYCVGKVAEARL